MARHGTPSTPWYRELDIALTLAHEAGQTILSLYNHPLQIDRKAGDELVTEADRKANQLIVEGLRRAFPHDAILAEESEDDRRRLEYRRVWMVDPIDGTADFIKHNGEFAVMIGLAVDGAPVLGVVHRPTTGATYWGGPTIGAFREQNGASIPLHVSSVADPAQMRLAVSRSHPDPRMPMIQAALGIRHARPHGSLGLKVALILEGECDLYIHLPSTSKEWDACAPEAILRAAGGEMTDAFGRRRTYNQPDVYLRDGTIASNGHAHDQIVAVVARFLQTTNRST